MTLKKATLLFSFFLLLLFFILARLPGHNGDMPFYIACIIETEQGSMQGVVEKTKEVLQNELPSAEYQDHAARFGSADPVILERYRVKPLYIWMATAFHKLGFSYIHSTILPSLLAYFLIGLSIWRILMKRLDPVKTFLLSTGCMLIYPTLLLARLSTPDAISCLFLLNAISLIYNGGNKMLWYILFILAICTRIDNVVSELIFLFALWRWPVTGFLNKLTTKHFVGLSFGLIGMGLLVNLVATHHFLWFMNPAFSLPPGQYLRDVSLYFYVFPGSFFMYLLLFFIISGFDRGFSWKKEVNYLFYAVCFIVAVRFLLYPFYEERYIAPWLLFCLLSISFSYAGLGNRLKRIPGKGV